MRLLLVEDEARMAGFIEKGLRENAYAVDVVRDGEEALYRASVSDYDALILDVMLPKVDGVEVCRRLRLDGNNAPVLMLTARDSTSDKIAGLDAGADDYLTKPFAFDELLARIRALLRRGGDVRPAAILIADLEIDTAAHRVRRGEAEVSLTAKEYALLEYLARERGKIVSRSEIAEHVWDDNFDAFSNLIEVYIKRLRTKIDDGYLPHLIHTRRGAGYILDDV